jgi:periplasmic divalent cation tolerance protein
VEDEALVVLCTCPDAATAERIAAVLVEERLAACVNALPVSSTYRWEGQVRRDTEMLLLIKTTGAAYGPTEARLRDLHPYELPEVVAVPIVRGSPAYLEWLRGALSVKV